jgi:hypothetical protein
LTRRLLLSRPQTPSPAGERRRLASGPRSIAELLTEAGAPEGVLTVVTTTDAAGVVSNWLVNNVESSDICRSTVGG